MQINSSSASLNDAGLYTKPKTAPPPDRGDPGKIVVEVTPGVNNATMGDRPQNTVQVSISTPNRDKDLEVSREQVFNAVEKRAYDNILQQASGDNNNLKKSHCPEGCS